MNNEFVHRLQQICTDILAVSRSIRVLTHLGWPLSVRETFFANGCRELPAPEYADYDAAPIVEELKRIGSRLDFDQQINEWLLRILTRFETTALMLQSCGTRKFFEYSSDLYGFPKQVLADSQNSPIELAEQFSSAFNELCKIDLGAPAQANLSSQQVASSMERAVAEMFGDQAPDVVVVDKLSANALAGSKRIRIRREAMFTDRDVYQLIEHEAAVHVGTSLNGLNQPILKVLATAHPGTTRTQEGLAVFAEFISGSMDLDRFRRLADRIIAIQMAVDGADFLQVFEFYREQGVDEIQAFENTRRVFRGGVLKGGAPFTKDIVYLDGLLRVHNFLRTMVSVDRAGYIRLLFCGKLDLEDLPILARLHKEGICATPRYLPSWASDLRFLLCYLSYSLFLNRIDLSQVRENYRELLLSLPEI